MDLRARKLTTIHWALNPKSDVARIYLPRKEGESGLTNAEDTVKLAILELERCELTSEEGLLIEHLGMIESVKEFKQKRRNKRNNVLKQKKLHRQFFNQIEEVAGEEKWLWHRSGSIKIETESLIMAGQEQAIRTNAIKAKIDKTQAESKCRFCGKVDETVRHIVCERRHGWAGRKIH